jgi:hypothetical protein
MGCLIESRQLYNDMLEKHKGLLRGEWRIPLQVRVDGPVQGAVNADQPRGARYSLAALSRPQERQGAGQIPPLQEPKIVDTRSL